MHGEKKVLSGSQECRKAGKENEESRKAGKEGLIFFLALGSGIFFQGSGLAQIQFTLGFELEGAECGGTLIGAPGSTLRFDVFATLTQENFETGKGASGWSIQILGENLRFLPETAASGRSCGTGEQIMPIPEFFCSPFVMDHSLLCGPLAPCAAINSAVVDGVALEIGKSLQGNGTFQILKVSAEVEVPEDGSVTLVLIAYRGGLIGGGQPVTNGITSGGTTKNVASGQLTLAPCELRVMAPPPGWQRPGDADQNGVLELNDAIALLERLFLSGRQAWPCEQESVYLPGNGALLDFNGDGETDISDPIRCLSYLFLGGPPHILGSGCAPIPGCPPVLCR